MVGSGRARNIGQHTFGILMYFYGINCSVLRCFAMQCSSQEYKPNVNGDLLYVFKSVFSTMNICGNIESTRSFGI